MSRQFLHWTACVSLVFLLSALEHQVISHCPPHCFAVLEFNMTPIPSPSAHVLMTPFVQISDWWTRRQLDLPWPRGVKGQLTRVERTSLSHLQLSRRCSALTFGWARLWNFVSCQAGCQYNVWDVKTRARSEQPMHLFTPWVTLLTNVTLSEF